MSFWRHFFFLPLFHGIQLVVVTVLPHRCNSRTDSGEAKVESHTSPETQPNQAASWHNAHPTRKPAAPMCQRKHRKPSDLVSVHCAQPATGVASARLDKDIPAGPAGQTLHSPDDAVPIMRRPMSLPVAAGCGRAWAWTQSLWWHSLRPLRHPGGRDTFIVNKNICF